MGAASLKGISSELLKSSRIYDWSWKCCHWACFIKLEPKRIPLGPTLSKFRRSFSLSSATGWDDPVGTGFVLVPFLLLTLVLVFMLGVN